MSSLNLFATALTHAAPSCNCRGETEENRVVLQKIRKDGQVYTVISPEAMRSALRETLRVYGLPMNRRRVRCEEQLGVEFQDYPDPARFADDFLFGFMVADRDALAAHPGRPSKRDSLLRMNFARACSPFPFDATCHQAPRGGPGNPLGLAAKARMFYREVVDTAYQFPFALALADCAETPAGPEWTRALLRAIGELSRVAGGQSRSYFEMAPCSLLARLTPGLCAGFDTYGFDPDGGFPDLARLNPADLPGHEFWIGGALVRGLPPRERERLLGQGARLFDNPQVLLEELGQTAFGDQP
jgi:CRISPR-associated protein Cst2